MGDVIRKILGEAPSPDMWKGIGDEDIIGHYKLGMHTKFISDILVDAMEMPEG